MLRKIVPVLLLLMCMVGGVNASDDRSTDAQNSNSNLVMEETGSIAQVDSLV